MRRLLSPLRNERGASLAIMAVMIVGLLSVTALAIDLGMLYRTRGEAQRAADAAALAGASTWLEMPVTDPAADDSVYARAYRLATANHMTGGLIQQSEVAVQPNPAAYRVDVWVRRASVGTWFARIFGVSSVPIGAHAAAAAVSAGAAKCLKPMAIADLWDENYVKTGQGSNEVGDENNNNWEDLNEFWDFTPASAGGTDRYQQWDASNPGDPLATGYGSPFRNGNGLGVTNDFGLPLILKENKGGDGYGPGWFGAWRPDSNSGAADWRESMVKDCPFGETEPTILGEPQRLEPGNMLGPSIQEQGGGFPIDTQYGKCTAGAFRCLLDFDPSAEWDVSTGQVVGSKFGNWRDSPRVIKVAVVDPNHLVGLTGGNPGKVPFNNFVLLFLDEIIPKVGSEGAKVVARFLYSLPGTGEPGEGPNTLVRKLVLVE